MHMHTHTHTYTNTNIYARAHTRTHARTHAQDNYTQANDWYHRRWRRGGQGGHDPPLFVILFARKDRDTLIEQSGSGYSNRAVTVFREAVWQIP